MIKLGETVVPWKTSVVYLGSRVVEDCRTLPYTESVVLNLSSRDSTLVYSSVELLIKNSKDTSIVLQFSHLYSTAYSTAHSAKEINVALMDFTFVLSSGYVTSHLTIIYLTKRQQNA